jgi:hypothetical protein
VKRKRREVSGTGILLRDSLVANPSHWKPRGQQREKGKSMQLEALSLQGEEEPVSGAMYGLKAVMLKIR